MYIVYYKDSKIHKCQKTIKTIKPYDVSKQMSSSILVNTKLFPYTIHTQLEEK